MDSYVYINIFSWLWWIIRKKLKHVSWQDILSCLRCTAFSSWQERWIGTQHNTTLSDLLKQSAQVWRPSSSPTLTEDVQSGHILWPHTHTHTRTHTHTHTHALTFVTCVMTSTCSHCGLPFCHILVECQFCYVQCSRCHLQVTSRNVLGSDCYCVFNSSAFVTECRVCQVSLISCLLLSL